MSELDMLKRIEEALNAIAAASRRTEADFYYQRAEAALAAGNRRLALILLDHCASFGDLYYTPIALFRLAELARSANLQKRERAAYERMVSLPPDQQNILMPSTLAVYNERIGKRDEALKLHERAIREEPDMQGTLGNFAEFLIIAGKYEQATSVAEKLISSPSTSHILIGRYLKVIASVCLKRKVDAKNELDQMFNLAQSLKVIPPDFSWDFSDLQPIVSTLYEYTIPLRLLEEYLRRKISFEQFEQQWSAIRPSVG